MQLCGDAVSTSAEHGHLCRHKALKNFSTSQLSRDSVVRYTFSNIYKNLPALGTRNALRSVESLI